MAVGSSIPWRAHWAWFRWVLAGGLLAWASWHSREALVITAGLLTAISVVLWRISRESERPEPISAPEIAQESPQLAEAPVHGNSVVTELDGRKAAVDATLAPSKSGVRLPVFRVRIQLNSPIPFCFTLRRRNSPFAVDALVSNTPLERPAFEYELQKLPLNDPEIHRAFEVAANLPRLMRRLLDGGLEEVIGALSWNHDFRLEEMTYDGSRITVLLQSAEDPRTHPLADDAMDRAQLLAVQVEAFIRDEGLEEAIRES